MKADHPFVYLLWAFVSPNEFVVMGFSIVPTVGMSSPHSAITFKVGDWSVTVQSEEKLNVPISKSV